MSRTILDKDFDLSEWDNERKIHQAAAILAIAESRVEDGHRFNLESYMTIHKLLNSLAAPSKKELSIKRHLKRKALMIKGNLKVIHYRDTSDNKVYTMKKESV
jgi:hypothetical protein|tara:strand:- start:3291 stop:3599 length:309 start_codon:yes stop_codon:yes gene_type:complete